MPKHSKDFLLKESKYFCMAPWTHMHSWPNGRTFACCQVQPQDHEKNLDYGNTNENSIYELWNSKTIKELRLNMLNEKPSNSCKRCYEIENDAESSSLRKKLNDDMASYFYQIEETKDDGGHGTPKMAYFDLRFSNLCNMMCRTCSPVFSSMWYDDFVKAYGEVPKSVVPKKFLNLSDKENFMEQLWPLMNDVKECYWAGGEPLITTEHWDIMNYWVEQNHSKTINVEYNTNFLNLKYKGQSVFDLWNKFENVEVLASLDGSYTRGEYIRKGTNWKTIVDNRKEMIKHTPSTHFKIGPTVSMMNIWHLPDFHREWIEQGLIEKPKDVHWNILTGPEWFNIQVLPKEFKKEVDSKWRKHLCWINKNSKPNNYHSSAIKGVLTYMNSADKSHLLPTTIEKLNFIDKVRNETWQETFPELSWLVDYKN
jgi:hypothetical protein